jgi:hypothetical protein
MISVKFGFINMWSNDKKSYLVPGPIDSLFTFNKYNAPRNEYFSESIDLDGKIFDIGKTAYRIVEEIYLWFGVSLDQGNIPYIKSENSLISIDVEQIKER